MESIRGDFACQAKNPIQAWLKLNVAATKRFKERVLYDKTDGNILFVMPSEDDPRNIKVTVKTDFYERKLKQKINSVRSVFKVGAAALDDRTRYEVIR